MREREGHEGEGGRGMAKRSEEWVVPISEEMVFVTNRCGEEKHHDLVCALLWSVFATQPCVLVTL